MYLQEIVPFTADDYAAIADRLKRDDQGQPLLFSYPIIGLKKRSAREVTLAPFKRWIAIQRKAIPEINKKKRK